MKKILKYGSAAVAATAAALVLTPLGATAASLIDSGDIKDQTIQSRDIAAEGVGTSEVRNQSLQSVDIDREAVGQSEIRTGSVHHTELSKGVWAMMQDAEKTNGTQDGQIADLETRMEAEEVEGDTVGFTALAPKWDEKRVASGEVVTVELACDEGQAALGGGFYSDQDANAFTVTQNGPGAGNFDAENEFANGWVVTATNTSDQKKNIAVWVSCATV